MADLEPPGFHHERRGPSPDGWWWTPLRDRRHPHGIVRCVGEPERRFDGTPCVCSGPALCRPAGLHHRAKDSLAIKLKSPLCVPHAERVRDELEKTLLTGTRKASDMISTTDCCPLRTRRAKSCRPLSGAVRPAEKGPARWAVFTPPFLKRDGLHPPSAISSQSLRLDWRTIRCCANV